MTKDQEIDKLKAKLAHIEDTWELTKKIQGQYKERLLEQQESGQFADNFSEQGGFYAALAFSNTLFESAIHGLEGYEQ